MSLPETGLAFRAGLVQCGLRLGDAVALQSDAGVVHGGAHRVKTRGRTPCARSIVLVLPELHRGQVAARAGLVAAATARERGRCDDAAGTKRGDRSHRRDTGLHHLPAKVHVNEPPLTLSVHPLPQSFRSWPRRLFFQGVAGLPTAGITGGSHRLARQPPTSLTDDTPNHGAWRLQKSRNISRQHGHTGMRGHGFTGKWVSFAKSMKKARTGFPIRAIISHSSISDGNSHHPCRCSCCRSRKRR